MAQVRVAQTHTVRESGITTKAIQYDCTVGDLNGESTSVVLTFPLSGFESPPWTFVDLWIPYVKANNTQHTKEIDLYAIDVRDSPAAYPSDLGGAYHEVPSSWTLIADALITPDSEFGLHSLPPESQAKLASFLNANYKENHYLALALVHDGEPRRNYARYVFTGDDGVNTASIHYSSIPEAGTIAAFLGLVALGVALYHRRLKAV